MTGGTTYTLRPSPNPLLYYFGLCGPLTGFKLRFISVHQYYIITKFRVDRSLTHDCKKKKEKKVKEKERKKEKTNVGDAPSIVGMAYVTGVVVVARGVVDLATIF